MMKDLLRAEQQLREDVVSVVPVPGVSKRSIDRDKIRSWKPLPNIKDFAIELRPMDWLTKLFKLKLRLPAKMTYHKWYNDGANVYLEYMFNRLRKQVVLKKYDEAVKTIWILMNSTAYQVSAINHVFKNWHRKLTWREVRILSKEVNKLVRQRASNINFSRVYIPKGDTHRPLGVPTPAWRVYLHMYNNCLVEWRTPTERDKQHGYLPGKGVITAWMRLTSLLNKPHIYEADFKGFFNNVTHLGIRQILIRDLNLPFDEINFLTRINKSLVKLQSQDKIEETDRMYPFDKFGIPNPQADPKKDPRLISANAFTLYMSNPQLFPTINDAVKFVQAEKAKMPEERSIPLNTYYVDETMTNVTKDRGVPQGAPTSCSLSTLALRRLESNHEILFYADDVIYFPQNSTSNPIKMLTSPKFGLEVNEEKSQWVKKNGKWLVDSFKFLGIRYYPPRTERDWASILIVLPWMVLLDVLIGTPLFTILLGLSALQKDNYFLRLMMR